MSKAFKRPVYVQSMQTSGRLLQSASMKPPIPAGPYTDQDVWAYPGVQKHPGLCECFGKIWQVAYAVIYAKIGGDWLLPSGDNSAEAACGVVQEHAKAVVYVNSDSWSEDDYEDAVNAITEALHGAPGSKPYLIGDNGSDYVIVVTEDPDALTEALKRTHAVWFYDLDGKDPSEGPGPEQELHVRWFQSLSEEEQQDYWNRVFLEEEHPDVDLEKTVFDVHDF